MLTVVGSPVNVLVNIVDATPTQMTVFASGSSSSHQVNSGGHVNTTASSFLDGGAAILHVTADSALIPAG